MPQHYTIDEQQQVIWTRCWGVLSDADIATQQTLLRQDPRFRPTLNQVVDTREVTEVAISSGMVKQMGVSTLFAPAAKRAYVVGKDALYGIARMYELHQSARGGDSIRVFRDLAVALAWLGVNEQASGPLGDKSQSA